MSVRTITECALEQGQGFLRPAPNGVPRSFCVPGRRLKLHPDDYYALGARRVGIDERWFSSTTRVDNGLETPPDEGLSYVLFEDRYDQNTYDEFFVIEQVALPSICIGQADER